MEHCRKIYLHNTGKYFMLNTVARFNYTKYWEILSVKHCGKIYLHKILRNTFWWNSVGRFIYTNYWEIHYVEHWENIFTQNTGKYIVEHCRKIYLHKILGNTLMLNTVGRCIYTKYWRVLYVEHCGKIYLHKISRNTLWWTLWEYFFTQNTGNTLCWALWED
jgi:hypothetical protein